MRAAQRRHAREAAAPEKLANLDVGIRPGLEAAEQLHDQLRAEQHGRVALVRRRAADRRSRLGRRPIGRETEVDGAQLSGSRWKLALVLDRPQQRHTRRVVEKAVVEHALARTGNPRDDRRGVLLFDGRGLGAARHGERNGIPLTASILVDGFDDGQEGGMGALAQRHPVR